MNARKRMIETIKQLLDHYSIEHITVDMITSASDLSKSTFYRYFDDKYALMQEYYFYEVDHVLSKEGSTFEEMYTNLLIFIKENKNYFRELIRQNKNEDFFHVFYKSSYKNSVRLIEEHKKSPLSESMKQEVSFFIAGCAYMTEKWIDEDCQQPCNEFISIIVLCVPENIKPYL